MEKATRTHIAFVLSKQLETYDYDYVNYMLKLIDKNKKEQYVYILPSLYEIFHNTVENAKANKNNVNAIVLEAIKFQDLLIVSAMYRAKMIRMTGQKGPIEIIECDMGGLYEKTEIVVDV